MPCRCREPISAPYWPQPWPTPEEVERTRVFFAHRWLAKINQATFTFWGMRSPPTPEDYARR